MEEFKYIYFWEVGGRGWGWVGGWGGLLGMAVEELELTCCLIVCPISRHKHWICQQMFF